MPFDIGAALGGLVGGGISALSNNYQAGKQFDRTKKLMGLQQKNQQELNAEQEAAQGRLNVQGQGLQLDTWNKTNAEAQRKHLENAGLSVGLMYGQGGAGGATVGSQGGGSAQGGSAGGGQAALGKSMDIGSMMQAAMLAAQIRNLDADTGVKLKDASVKGEDIVSKKFDNELRTLMKPLIEEGTRWDWNVKQIEGEEKNAVWEWKKAIEYGQDVDEKGWKSEISNKTLKYRAEVGQAIQNLQNAKTNNDIDKAKQTIEEFRAGLTAKGIDPNSPWYAKLVTDLLSKAGLLNWLK